MRPSIAAQTSNEVSNRRMVLGMIDWRDVQLNLQAAALGTMVAVPLHNALECQHRNGP